MALQLQRQVVDLLFPRAKSLRNFFDSFSQAYPFHCLPQSIFQIRVLCLRRFPRADENDNLPKERGFLDLLKERLRGSASETLVDFGEFPSKSDLTIGKIALSAASVARSGLASLE